jgi:uncharacterized damage-inducible protein DinB
MRVLVGMLVGLAGTVGLAAAVGAQSRAGAPQPVAGAIKASWDGAKKNMRDSAEFMPEANFSFKPVDTVRTFGQIVAHTAGANYVFCSAIKGEKSPQAESAFEGLATKAAILKAWDESVTYCDAAYSAATDRTIAEVIDQPFGSGKGPRAAALLGNIGHLNEHYGNLVTYMRMKGIVPPTSRR